MAGIIKRTAAKGTCKLHKQMSDQAKILMESFILIFRKGQEF